MKPDVRMLALTLLMVSASGEVALGQNVAEGKRIAQRWCSSCHLVGSETTASDAVPSFYSVAQMPSTTRMSLAAFLSTPHAPMPNFVLSRKDIADVSAYILTLRKPSQPDSTH